MPVFGVYGRNQDWSLYLKKLPREGLRRGPKEVMVLKATEPFIYDVKEGKMMFQATVATESRFFQVKIFNVKFWRRSSSLQSHCHIRLYWPAMGSEVFSVFSVSDVNPDRKMEISKSLIQKAKATPKISHLYLQRLGTFVNGVFVVHKASPRHCFAIFLLQSQNSKILTVKWIKLINTGTQSLSDQG